jgi:branched-chain amino acid transport system substrate-binding protein
VRKRRLGAVAVAACTVAGSAVLATPAFAASSKAPIVIGYATIQSGSYASPGRNNDINLVVNTINHQGGVDGHMLKWVPYDTSTTPSQAVTATQQAIGNKVTAIVGYSVDDQVQASASLLKQSGIPVLSYAQGPAASSQVVDVPHLYTVVPNLVSAIQGGTTYGYTKFHPKSVGIFHTDDTASDADAATAIALLRKEGVHNFVERDASDTATDATEQALAMKGESVVYEYGFPLVEAVFNTALNQNGINIPIMGDQSGNFLAAYGLNKPAELTKYQFTPYCFAPVLKTPQAEAYVKAYTAAYPGQSVQIATPYTYDAVEFLAAAIKSEGGNLSSSAISKAMSKLTYNGVCGQYHTDVNHDLIHQVTVVSFANGITPGTLAAKYIEPPVPKAYFTAAKDAS